MFWTGDPAPLFGLTGDWKAHAPTLRDLIAMQAMDALLRSGRYTAVPEQFRLLAHHAYRIADEMIEERCNELDRD